MSDSDDDKKSDEITDSDDNDDSDQGSHPVPEINFQPQFSPYSPQSKVDEDFRSKHPLFDAPEMIDDHDELNAQENLSSDDEADNKQEQNQENNAGSILSNGNTDNNFNYAEQSSNNSSFLAMNDHDNAEFAQSNLIPQEGSPNEPDDDVPVWRKFSLPPTPEPDDTEIDAAIQDQFSISKLLQQIRTG